MTMTEARTLPEFEQQELKRITERIIDLCETALATGKPYFVSKLGIDLGGDIQKIRILTGEKWTDFFRSNPDLKRYTIVPVEGRGNVWVSVKSNEASHAAAAPVQLPAQTQANAPPRFHYRFWAAFAIPSDGRRRYLNPTDFTFRNVDEGEDPPEGWLLIEHEFIAPEVADSRDKLINENIENWLARHNLQKSTFLARPRVVAIAERNLLSAVIGELDKRQLQSISLPLDVVAALMSKKL